MLRTILFFLITTNLSGQINYIIDTTIMTHSERFPLAAGVMIFNHYFIANEDVNISREELKESSYRQIEKQYSNSKKDGKYIILEDLIQIKSFKHYSFVFPFSLYNINEEMLFDHGIEVVDNLGLYRHFSEKPNIIVNFYNRERAIHYLEVEEIYISGEDFSRISKEFDYDRIEIVLKGRYRDVLKMNLFLQ